MGLNIKSAILLVFACLVFYCVAVELDYCGGQHPPCNTDEDCSGLPCPYCNMKKKICGLNIVDDYCGGQHPPCNTDADCASLACPFCNSRTGRCGLPGDATQ